MIESNRKYKRGYPSSVDFGVLGGKLHRAQSAFGSTRIPHVPINADKV